MIYKIYSDGYTIYDSELEEYPIFNTQIELELNKTGSFVFDIYPDHPNFDKLHKLKSIIKIEQDGELIFKGRVINDNQGFYNQKQVTCEGVLAYFLDSVIRPYGSETEPLVCTPEAYLRKLVDEHNSQVDEWKQFKIGTVTVEADASTGNITRHDTEYKTTLDLINEKLIEPLGGYLWVRYEVEDGKEVNYLDYLSDISVLAEQTIKLGKNLLDIKKLLNGEDVMTGIIPLGDKPDGSDTRVTIAEVSDSEDDTFLKEGDSILHKESATELGRIFKIVTFEGVTDPSLLFDKAKVCLADAIKFSGTIEITAADLAGIENVNPFRLGRKIEIEDDYHDLEEVEESNGTKLFLVEKLSINPLAPASNKLTTGTTFKTFTETTTGFVNTQGQVTEKVNRIESSIKDYVTREELDDVKIELTEEAVAEIVKSSDTIMTRIAEDYYLKEDANELVQSIETQFTQTNEKFEFEFSEFSQNVNAQFSDISKYIRFVDGNIILGESGNEITLRIENDRIRFLSSGVEVAYFSNNQLTVLDGTFLNSLRIGKFAFLPRANGNLSLIKVG